MDCKLQTEMILLTRLQKIVSAIWIYYKFNWHLVSWPGKRVKGMAVLGTKYYKFVIN